jgi:hypothetical protein|tara:strand:- start:46 stop:516 length:471 start_codon:yes stop_codon:yes gene_type:complete
MRRFTIRTLFIIIALVAAGFWLFDSGYRSICRQPLSDRNLLNVAARQPLGSTDHEIRITYHYPPGFLFAIREFRATKPKGGWKFNVIDDKSLDKICIYDENDLGWLWIYDVANGDLWESTPHRSGSWYDTIDDVWQERLDELRGRHPEIPYAKLPR